MTGLPKKLQGKMRKRREPTAPMQCLGGWKLKRLALYLAVTALLWSAASGSVLAQQAEVVLDKTENECRLFNMRTGVHPDNGTGVTNVDVSIIVADFLGVNDVDQQLDIDLFATFTWVDPRLESYQGCRFGKTEVWFPRVVLINSSSLRVLNQNAANQVMVGEGGQVFYQQRYTGNISSYHDLQRFPFDKQAFKIKIATQASDARNVVLTANVENTWISDTLNIEGWNVHGVEIVASTSQFRATGEDHSLITLIINADRNPDYYLYRVMLLLMFVVFMSWAIFWIPPSRFEFQIGLGATSMLTSIAFNLSVANNLPQLGYLTILDMALIWAIFLIFLSIVEALVAGLLVMKDRESSALKLDKVCRVVFPALLFGGWYLIVQTA
ncbi:hypothetical protein [Falsihalocynthiibacter arcticus]|uniref:hypothetical protein n=1 Tax=Falsihalocynthiibacter arcticus TaxID=1579316 RepID=UPI003002754D